MAQQTYKSTEKEQVLPLGKVNRVPVDPTIVHSKGTDKSFDFCARENRLRNVMIETKKSLDKGEVKIAKKSVITLFNLDQDGLPKG